VYSIGEGALFLLEHGNCSDPNDLRKYLIFTGLNNLSADSLSGLNNKFKILSKHGRRKKVFGLI
jgi:hypothetical protein